jgi:hypothetical protein
MRNESGRYVLVCECIAPLATTADPRLHTRQNSLVCYRIRRESKTVRTKPITPPAIRARKGGEPIICLTSYTAPMARLVGPHVDLILVGDSLAMTVYGMVSNVGVGRERLIAHGPRHSRKLEPRRTSG